MKSLLSKSLLGASVLLCALAPLSAEGTAAAPCTAASAECPSNPAGFVIRRGVNLSHWLSQDFGWKPRATWITENDIRYIRSIGYDHVRLPLDEKEIWTKEGKLNEDAFALVEKALGWCAASGLRVIVDLHTVNSHHFNAENEGLKNTLFTDPKSQEAFLKLWKDLSSRLHKYPVNQVAYEILNEPVADKHEQWNALIAASLQELRKTEPQRVVVIGANRWQIPENVPFLKPPAGDKNIILSTHTYSPFPFTHYTANWTPLKDYKGPVQYPGATIPEEEHRKMLKSKNQSLLDQLGPVGEQWNRERIAKMFAPAIRHARELGLQLYVGEFGCLPTVARKDRLAYYGDIVGVMESKGMAWANWEYKGDFGIFEWHGAGFDSGAPDSELIDTLMGRRR